MPVSVKALPATPTIQQKSLYFLEAISVGSYANPVGDIFEWKQENNPLGFTTPIIKVNKSNFFACLGFKSVTVNYSRHFGCCSKANKSRQ